MEAESTHVTGWRVSVSIMGNANEAQPRTVERCSARIRLTILAGMLRFLRLNSRRSIIMQATHPKAGFRPQAASIGSSRKSMRDRQLRQNWKVNDGRAAA
ncbi:MAG TPA: hypothetical protein VN641_05590, partial [Urbifossiella sp.]|nr:hypothetical protein [Urbifossiella sp.]